MRRSVSKETRNVGRHIETGKVQRLWVGVVVGAWGGPRNPGSWKAHQNGQTARVGWGWGTQKPVQPKLRKSKVLGGGVGGNLETCPAQGQIRAYARTYGAADEKKCRCGCPYETWFVYSYVVCVHVFKKGYVVVYKNFALCLYS